jgi:hypothetical protein
MWRSYFDVANDFHYQYDDFVPPASLLRVGLDTRQDRLGQKEIQVPSDFVQPWFFRLRAAIVKIVTEFNGK